MIHAIPTIPSTVGQPTWELATYYPNQGDWTEAEYFALHPDRGVELSDGCLEFLPMPTEHHQEVAAFLFELLRNFVRPLKLGKVLYSGLRVRLRSGKIREPDVVFMATQNASRRSDAYWRGADLAMEVVSPDDPKRDLEVKREEYAAAGIQEYWIVDPRDSTITLLVLEQPGQPYVEAGRFVAGQEVESRLLPGFRVNVAAAFTHE